MPLRRIAGHDIWVSEIGDGPPRRLMAHCSLASHATLLPLARRLGPGRTTLFDLPGHGRSGPWNGQGDYQALVVEICEALLDGRPAEIIGHSFGATAALHLALKCPALIDRLVLIDPVFFAAARGTAEHTLHARRFAPFVAAMEAGERARAVQIFLALWGEPGAWAALGAGQRQAMADRIALIPAADPAMNGDCHGQLAPGRLEGLRAPVVLLEGAKTEPVVHAINDTLERRLPVVRRARIAGAGHMVPVTHVEAVAAAL